jgi:hypothetical protein
MELTPYAPSHGGYSIVFFIYYGKQSAAYLFDSIREIYGESESDHSPPYTV